jgi:hypothetical protein
VLRHAARPLLALAFALAPAWSEAALYRWVDEAGVTHYTTDLDAIPSSARDNALEIVASPVPVAATRALPVPPAPAAAEPAPPEAAAVPLEIPPAPVEAAPPPLEAAPVPLEAAPAPLEAAPAPLEPAPMAPAPSEPATATPELAPPAPTALEPAAPAPVSAPEAEPSVAAPAATPAFPGPPSTPAIDADDPRAAEVAQLEAQIAADRERLRQMISTKRWDSAELASDPSIREIAERLPRLQAELAALRAETVP